VTADLVAKVLEAERITGRKATGLCSQHRYSTDPACRICYPDEVALNQGPRRDDGVGSNPDLCAQDRHLASKNEVSIVSLLRLQSPFSDGLCHKAADEIERLQRELEVIRAERLIEDNNSFKDGFDKGMRAAGDTPVGIAAERQYATLLRAIGNHNAADIIDAVCDRLEDSPEKASQPLPGGTPIGEYVAELEKDPETKRLLAEARAAQKTSVHSPACSTRKTTPNSQKCDCGAIPRDD
jgi:hypothetical protein